MNINELLSKPENRKLEIKRDLPRKSDLLKTIVAFANGAGGHLIVGVSDKEHSIIGVADPLEMEERISRLIYYSIAPIISPYISVVDIDGNKTLYIIGKN